MNKTFHIALREFKATVLTKGFLVGVLILPVLMLGAIPAAMLLITNKPPAVRGVVAVVDRSPAATPALPDLLASLTPDSFARSERENRERAARLAAEAVESATGEKLPPAADTALAAVPADAPQISVDPLPPDTDVEEAKASLLGGTTFDGSRLALLVIDPTAVVKPDADPAFGGYQLFVKRKLDARVEGLINDLARRGVLDARLRANGEDPLRMAALMSLPEPKAVAVTEAGDKASGGFQQMMLPLGFMLLLWIAVFTGGQYLLTSTIEEKSNRIMEVLLSAVSPVQLMTGKILGQMSAGLLILLLYSGLGISSLLFFNRSDLLDWTNVLFLILFFFIAFFLIASMMAAIGSVVTDVHEAQTLLTPIMLVVMTPMLLMMPIIWNPKSALATTLSFIPPINPFVMVLRLSSSDPPPLWQTLLSLAVGVVAAYLMVRAAAKIFRVGVLLYGKPPNFATLVRWVRMA